MKRDEIKNLIKLQEPSFLPRARHKGYICPSCGNGRGSDGDGIVRTPGSEHFHCFKCGLHADVFGLIGEYYSLTEFKDQLNKACELYALDSGELKKPSAPQANFALEEAEEEAADYSGSFREWNHALNEGDNPGLAYMLARGLSLETLNRFGVGYAAKWKHPKTAHLSKVPPSPRVIIPTSPSSYLARDPRKPDNIPEKARKYMKSKVGKAHLFNADVLSTTNDVVFLVEGEIDAMSLEEIGEPAIGLGSASNKRRLIDLIKDHKPTAMLVLLPDNDEAGKKAAEEITEDLKALGVASMVAEIFGDCKDANELLVKDRKHLEELLVRTKRQAAELRTKRAPMKDIDACNREMLRHLNLHPRHLAWLKEQGLNEKQISRFCYRSSPSDPKAVCKELKRAGCTLDGNPTFRDENGEETLNLPSSGILVPERNSKGKFQGFSVITDDGKEYCGGNIHFRRGIRGTEEAVILGSPLEADIVSALSGYTVLSVPEDFKEQLLLAALKALYEKGLRKARLSYDLWADSVYCDEERNRFAVAAKSCDLKVTLMKPLSEATLSQYLLQQMKEK